MNKKFMSLMIKKCVSKQKKCVSNIKKCVSKRYKTCFYHSKTHFLIKMCQKMKKWHEMGGVPPPVTCPRATPLYGQAQPLIHPPKRGSQNRDPKSVFGPFFCVLINFLMILCQKTFFWRKKWRSNVLRRLENAL